MLSEVDYQQVASTELAALLHALDSVEGLSADLEGGILVIEFEDDSKYVLNTQSAARQLWMAAARQAWHFEWAPGARQWVTTKGDEELWATLGQALSRQLGRDITLDRVP